MVLVSASVNKLCPNVVFPNAQSLKFRLLEPVNVAHCVTACVWEHRCPRIAVAPPVGLSTNATPASLVIWQNLNTNRQASDDGFIVKVSVVALENAIFSIAQIAAGDTLAENV